MDSILGFGKWQGFTIEDIIGADVQYIDWMMRTFEKDTWDEEISHALSRRLDRE
jgi:DNA-binding ferritin-like protein (Dps family)